MKIAIFHELDYGGAKRAVNEFSKKLGKIFDVDLYYVDNKEDKDTRGTLKNVYYYPFFPKTWKGNNWMIKLYKDIIELIKLYGLHKKITLDIKSKKYDYIFVHPSKFTQAPFLLKYLKNKCIYYCQEPLRMAYDPSVSSNIKSIVFPKNIYEFINRKIRKWIDLENFKSALVILANSNFSKNFIEKSYGKKAEVCYLGVDANLFKPLSINKSIDILFIGNNDKGYDLLNESLKFFRVKPKVHTIFRKGGNPSILDKELVEVYNKSKVLVALNQNEPFGLIPLEAMSCGTPVVAVEEGGYKESVIDNETGFLVSRDPKRLADAILKLLNNESLRNKMGKKSRENILENWTWDKSIKRFLEIIENVK